MYFVATLFLLVAFVESSNSQQSFAKQSAWPLVADDERTTLEARNRLDCASHLDFRDSGFAFNQSDHTCYLLHCVNPDVTNDSQSMSSIQLYLEHPLIADYTLARGKPTNMSSQHDAAYDGGKAVDGIYTPADDYSSLAHSALTDNNPWWRMDLEQVYCIWGVNILNRAIIVEDEPGENDRNKDVDVTVSRDETQLMYDINPDSKCNYFDGTLNRNYTLITCIQPMRGQFVQIQYRPSSMSVINLYEIEVYGV